MKAVLLLPAVLAFAACSSASAGGSGGASPKEGSVKSSASDGSMRGGPKAAGARDGGEEAAPVRSTKVAGTPPVRVTWEALAVELDQMKSSKRGPQLGFGGVQEYKVVLLNESNPEAPKVRRRTKEEEVAIISDEDMAGLLDGFEQAGFFKFAQSTGAIQRLFSGERSRGRITVERGDESVTLLSQRGLGLDPRTRDIPAIYAQAKAAVSIMKNRTPSLSVRKFTTEPVRPVLPGGR